MLATFVLSLFVISILIEVFFCISSNAAWKSKFLEHQPGNELLPVSIVLLTLIFGVAALPDWQLVAWISGFSLTYLLLARSRYGPSIRFMALIVGSFVFHLLARAPGFPKEWRALVPPVIGAAD